MSRFTSDQFSPPPRHPPDTTLTLVDVSPAADGAAVAIGERGAFVREADGCDERGSPHAAPVLLGQFDQD